MSEPGFRLIALLAVVACAGCLIYGTVKDPVSSAPAVIAAAPSASAKPDRWDEMKYERDVKLEQCVNKHGVPVIGFNRTDKNGNELEFGFVCVDENSVLPINGRRY